LFIKYAIKLFNFIICKTQNHIIQAQLIQSMFASNPVVSPLHISKMHWIAEPAYGSSRQLLIEAPHFVLIATRHSNVNFIIQILLILFRNWPLILHLTFDWQI